MYTSIKLCCRVITSSPVFVSYCCFGDVKEDIFLYLFTDKMNKWRQQHIFIRRSVNWATGTFVLNQLLYLLLKSTTVSFIIPSITFKLFLTSIILKFGRYCQFPGELLPIKFLSIFSMKKEIKHLFGIVMEFKKLKCIVGDAGRLPHLVPDQVLKLKQLTVLTLAETNKVLPYHQLMQELDVINVRELEHFLINECMYAGIIRGKLDQLRKCFEVQFAAGRDPRPGQLGSTIQTLSNWLDTSSNLLISIQEKMKCADTMTEVAKEHKKEVGNRVEEVKKSISIKFPTVKQADVDFRGHEEIYSEPGGVMDYEEDRSRPKRRRHPIYKS
ncbi:COP9 signalosome complex subunit 7-like isoform X2 [Malus sylvestris]|uniref:COP9 signalosome complex subunit 7-like isoform X2 n=1 Tax=Malus sylvestris TaxID=3752 RepID=UPI0021AC9097|nr:COP9 signalosome complex subunit 7-like isoform X2 [Malus sylvestris]